jgi:hypothetical protein
MESFPFIGYENSNQSARRTMNGSNVKVVLFFFIWRVASENGTFPLSSSTRQKSSSDVMARTCL